MSKPLELWLSTKLGRLVRLESNEMANLLFDGKIISELLASYGILIGSLQNAEDFPEALANLKALNETLSLLGLEQDEETLVKIAHRDRPYAVKLLIEIYVQLEQYWPYSKGSILGEPSFDKFRSSCGILSRAGSSVSSTSSELAESDAGSSISFGRVMQVFKEDTISACRKEMKAHRSSFRVASAIKQLSD